jgi:predicted TIM-barrel fold metal-dependent hydrolase
VDLDFQPIDADNHYYEPLDAFTRHLDPEFKTRGVQVVKDERGHTQLVIGGRVNRFIPNPTFDPIIVPGCLDLMFRGQVPDGADPRTLMQVEPLRIEYQDRDERAAVAERQGLGGVLLFPTLGCGVEEALKGDVDATMASLRAFNRWLEDDWGFVHAHRLVTAPMISLADPASAAEEVDRVIERGARIVHVRPAPVPGDHGTSRSLGDKVHDPVWARLAEASVPVAFHLGDSGYELFTAMWGGVDHFEGYGKTSILSRVLVSDRAIHDTIASMVVDGVFRRHPTLRVASIENGSDWAPLLAKRLKKQANQTPWAFKEPPLDVLRRNVWVTPYYEEDLHALADLIGVERILFGSDWPHGEGLAEPLHFTKELDGFDEPALRKIMRDNALDLLGVAEL